MSGAEIPILMGLGVIGTGVSVAGQLSAAESQAKASLANANMKRQQASEMESRNAVNEKILSDQFTIAQHNFASVSETASEGVAGLTQMVTNFEQNRALNRREVDFKARMLRMGAEQDTTLANDIKSTGAISATGTLLTGAVSAYTGVKKFSTPTGSSNLW